MANITNGTLASSMSSGVSTPEKTTYTPTARPAAQRQQSMVAAPVTTASMMTDARRMFDSGNEAGAKNVITNYLSQIGDKNSPVYQAQFTHWDMNTGDEQKTLAAESDLLSMYDAVSDAVNRGYSDSWIKNNISKNNYPGLASLNNDTVLTRQLQYLGDDTVNGMIYAARNNDEYSGDIYSSMLMYYMGAGNKYKPDYESEAARDPLSEIYHPYMQGNHMASPEADENTAKAKAELEQFQANAKARLEAGESADKVYGSMFDNGMEGLKAKYPTLFAMEYARTNKTAIDLSDDVDFAGPYVKEWLNGQADEIQEQQHYSQLYEMLTEKTMTFKTNIPEGYQDVVLDMYMRDKGITQVNQYSLDGLNDWLKEYGLDNVGNNFTEAYGAAVSKFNEKHKDDTDGIKFNPATFISSAGETADEATTKAQVSFRLGMMSYMAGMPITDKNAATFINDYNWLISQAGWVNNADTKEGGYIHFGSGTRGKVIGTDLDNALVRLDTARANGEISDEEYFDCYLEIAAVYDNYVKDGGEPVSASSGFWGNKVNSGFSEYLSNSYGEDGQTLRQGIIDRINERVDTSKAAYDEKEAAHKAEVSQKYGEWVKAENNGLEVTDPDYLNIKNIDIDLKAKTGYTSNEYDYDYDKARDFALKWDLAPADRAAYTEQEKYYNANFAGLASYDVVEKIDDIERLAIYNNISFAEAAQMMGIDDIEGYIYEQSQSVHNECLGVLENLYDVTNALVANPDKLKAEDLKNSGLITQAQYDKFRKAFGDDQSLYNNYYVRVKIAKDTGKESYAKNAAANTYKEALGQRKPDPDTAYGYSNNLWHIVSNGVQSGLMTHENSWVTAFLGWMQQTPQEREEYARANYTPAQYRQVLSDGFSVYNDQPEVKQALQSALDNYTGDIFKFDYDPSIVMQTMMKGRQQVLKEQQALNEEMKGLLTPDAFDWYNTVGTATNSVLLSTEAVFLAKALGASGFSPGMASLLAQMYTTGVVEGGEAAYELKEAGLSGRESRLAGLLIGGATAVSEYGMEGVINKAFYQTGLAKSIESIGKIDGAAKSMLMTKALTARGGGKTAAALMRFGIGTYNLAVGAAIGGAFEGLQEAQQEITSDALKALFTGDESYIKTSNEYSDLIVDTWKSSLLQQLNPMSVGRQATDFIRNQAAKNEYSNFALQNATEFEAEGMSEIGTAQTKIDEITREIADATKEREQSMNLAEGANLEALINQETAKRAAGPSLELHNSDLVKRIDGLTLEHDTLAEQIQELNENRGEATGLAFEAQQAVDAGDVSKEALDRVNDTTELVRSLDMKIENAQKEYDSQSEELERLKAERQAKRQEIAEKAKAEATEAVLGEAVIELQNKLAAAQQNLTETINKYQEQFKTYAQQMRSLASQANTFAQQRYGMEEGPISDKMVDAAIRIADFLSGLDVSKASKQEMSYKASLLKQMELSFRGYKVRYESLGKGNHGKMVMEGEKGTIILNSDASTWELMSGELGYELGRMAQKSGGEMYQALYKTVTDAVYGSKAQTDAVYNATVDALVNESGSFDINETPYQAQGEVFANAISRLLSGEFMGSNWVQTLHKKAPMLANNVFDWMAMRAKEFKKLARHADQKTKAQYNEFAKVLSQFSDTLKRTTREGFSGEQETVDTTPVDMGGNNEELTVESVMQEVENLDKPAAVEEKPAMPAPKLDDAQSEAMLNKLRKRREKLQKQQDEAERRLQVANDLNSSTAEMEQAFADEGEEAPTPTTDTSALQAEFDKRAQKLADLDEKIARLEHPAPAEQQTVLNENAETQETVQQENAETEEAPAETSTLSTEQEQSEEVKPMSEEQAAARQIMVDSIRAALETVGTLDAPARQSVLQKVHGLVQDVVNGRRSRIAANETNTPVALMRNALNSIGAIVYEKVGAPKVNDALVENEPTAISGSNESYMPNVSTSSLDSNVGAVETRNRLGNADMGSLIATFCGHVLNSIDQQAADGASMQLAGGDRQVNENLFTNWLLAGIGKYVETQQSAEFGNKLTIDLGKTVQGRAMLKVINETKSKLKAWYDGDYMSKVGAYVRTLNENKKGGLTNWLTKQKADWFGNDVIADAIDNMTDYATNLRKRARYIPYAQGMANSWIGDNDAAPGFHDINGNDVEGALTLHEAIMQPYSKTYFDLHRAWIRDNLGKLLMIDTSLDRIANGMNPYSTVDENDQMANYLNVNGTLTEDTLLRAKEQLLAQDPLLEQAAENVREWWRNVLQQAVKSGQMTQELYDQFQEKNPNYAPLQRDMSAQDAGAYNDAGVSLNIGGDVIADNVGLRFHKAKGKSARAVINPLISFADQAQAIANAIIRNDLAQEFVRAYDIAPSDMIGMFGKEITNEQADEMAQRGQDALNVYYEDGTRRSFVFNNKELFDLLADRKEPTKLWKLIRVIGAVTRTMASLTTSNNPLFAIRNVIRDYQMSVDTGSWAATRLTGLPKWGIAFVESFAYTLGKGINQVFNNSNKGWFTSQQMEDFISRGGEGFSRRDIAKADKESTLNSIVGNNFFVRTLEGGKNLITFNALQDAIEMASRYVEYKYGKTETKDSKGATDQDKFNAFMNSREVTVDFAQAGNGAAARIARKVFPFFNATLQGWYKTMRMFSEAERDRLPARLTKSILNNMVSGAISAAACLLGNALGVGDPEDWLEQAKEYLKISSDLKSGYILYPLSGFGINSPRDFIRVPLTQDMLGKVWFNAGRLAVENVYKASQGEDVDISSIGAELWGIAFDVLTEPVTRDPVWQPFLDIARNRTYYGTNAVSQSIKDNYSPEHWANQTTSRAFIYLSDNLRKLLGLKTDSAEWKNMVTSPVGLEYQMKELTGVIGQLVIPAISRDKYTRESVGFGKSFTNTIINQFTSDAESSNDNQKNFNALKNTLTQVSHLNEYTEGIAPLSTLLTSNERYEAVAEAQWALSDEGPIGAAQNAVKDLWTKYNEAMQDESLPEDERNSLAEAYRKQIDIEYEKANEWAKDYKMRWCIDTDYLSNIASGWDRMEQTLDDSGEGIGAPSRSGLVADETEQPAATATPTPEATPTPATTPAPTTTPKPQPQSTPVQTPPATSTEYTGERARGVSADYTPPSSQKGAHNAYNLGLRKYTGDTTINIEGKGQRVQQRQAMASALSTVGLSIGLRDNNAENAAQAMKRNYERGNVDLLNRPQVDASKLKAAGWNDAGEGTATVFSVMYTAGNTADYDYKWGNNAILHMTPIKADGTVLTQAQLESYANSLLRHPTIEGMLNMDRPENGGMGLMLWAQPVKGTLKDAMQTGEQYDESLHQLQEQYYLGGNNAPAQATQTAAVADQQKYTSNSSYNLARKVSDYDMVYNWSRKNDRLVNDYTRQLYGDALPQSYYDEVERLKKSNKTTKLIAVPSSEYTYDSTKYTLKDYNGAQADVFNWYTDYYVDGYKKLVNDPAYINGSDEKKLSALSTLDSEANTYAKNRFVLNYVANNTKGLANSVDASTLDVAMNMGTSFSTATTEQYIRNVYGSNLPDSWYSKFEELWKADKKTALLPFPASYVTVDEKKYYITDYAGASTDYANWYMDRYLRAYEDMLKDTDYQYGTLEQQAKMFEKLDSKATNYAKDLFKTKYLS